MIVCINVMLRGIHLTAWTNNYFLYKYFGVLPYMLITCTKAWQWVKNDHDAIIITARHDLTQYVSTYYELRRVHSFEFLLITGAKRKDTCWKSRFPWIYMLQYMLLRISSILYDLLLSVPGNVILKLQKYIFLHFTLYFVYITVL